MVRCDVSSNESVPTRQRSLTYPEAQRAIYVDFEQPKGSPANPSRPALLGVLIGARGEDFEQLIIDDRLAPAVVANHRCRVEVLPNAVADLLERAIVENRAIVGWSNFDRDRMIAALPHREGEIKKQYVNPLSMARQWARSIHPHVPIVRAAPASPRHTLDQYASLAGYPQTAKLAQGMPARWINDTLARLANHDGRYAAVSEAGKRDWRSLLEYNRHDCLALRHIVLKAARELECWRAYERTRFCVHDGGREVCFTSGSNKRPLEALLHRHRATRWAFITAWNPASEPLTREENDRRQRRLRQEVESKGYRWLPGEGRGEDPSWLPEQSLFILGIPEAGAIELARKFGQLAIVVGRRGKPARLASSAPPFRPSAS